MKNNKYKSYEESELDILMNEPWEVSDKPYMLHAAYALSCLHDMLIDDDEEDDEDKSIWGMSVSKNIIDRMVIDIKEDFNDAASNYKQIKIWGRSYAIRKVNSYDRKRLDMIFQFPVNNGEYIINKEGVLNLESESSNDNTYELAVKESQENRTYLRKIIALAEDDKNDGWDKLTDMEIILYCWGLYYSKYQNNNFIKFKDEYKDYFYVNESDIEKCFTEKSKLRGCPVGMCAFSFSKVQEWNRLNKQKSYASKISKEDADEYWYSNAINGNFKPIDFK